MHRTVTNGLWLHTKGGPQFTRFQKELENEKQAGSTIQRMQRTQQSWVADARR